MKEYTINRFATDSDKYAKISLSNGIAYIGDVNLKIFMLYDYRFILDSIDNYMAQMRNSCTLNTGKIDLPCGFYMFDSFFSTAGVTTHIGKNTTIIAHESSTSYMNLSYIGYTDSDEEAVSIREYGKRLFEAKKKWVKYDMSLGTMMNNENDEIDWERCFDQSNPDQLYKLFRDMQNNFSWSDINNMIYVHSLFGKAYTNAVLRVSEYTNSELSYICIPDSYIVYDEFRKILRKYYFKGKNIEYNIFVCYIKDYINPNKVVE